LARRSPETPCPFCRPGEFVTSLAYVASGFDTARQGPATAWMDGSGAGTSGFDAGAGGRLAVGLHTGEWVCERWGVHQPTRNR